MSLFDPTIQAQAATVTVAPPPAFHGLGDDAWFAASSRIDPLAPVTVQGMARPFLPWQESAYTFANDCIARWGGTLIGDDMGLGKTQVMHALAADAIHRTGRPAIIVIPPVGEAGHISDLRVAFPNLTITMVKGHKRKPLDPADIYLLSDDSRTMKVWLTDTTINVAGKEVIEASDWVKSAGIIIRDEIHRDKGSNGKANGRSKAMLAVGNYCRLVGMPIVGATGTLLTNRPIEGFFPLQTIGGDKLLTTITPGFHTARGYIARYCKPQQHIARNGQRYTKYGCEMDEMMKLHEYLRRTVYCRREKGDLGEGVLPHSGWKVSPLALPNGIMRRYQRVEKDFYNLCAEERGQVWADKVSRAQAIVQMNMLWEEAGVAKAEASADYIADLVEAGEQVVAFYIHKRVWEKVALALAVKGIEVVTINGAVTGEDRVWAIEDFQNSDAQVCLAQIKAAGMAVTLTAACHAVFIQVPWSAGDLKQAADRILRVDDITRDRAAAGGTVTWHVLQAHYSDSDPTFDAAMWSVLEKKAAICDAVNAGRPVTMDEESVMYEAMMAWQPSAKRHGGGW